MDTEWKSEYYLSFATGWQFRSNSNKLSKYHLLLKCEKSQMSRVRIDRSAIRALYIVGVETIMTSSNSKSSFFDLL